MAIEIPDYPNHIEAQGVLSLREWKSRGNALRSDTLWTRVQIPEELATGGIVVDVLTGRSPYRTDVTLNEGGSRVRVKGCLQWSLWRCCPPARQHRRRVRRQW